MEGDVAESAPQESIESVPLSPELSPNEKEGDPNYKDPYKGTKHKLKIDGKELELTYEDLLARAQKAEASGKKFEEAAALRKEAEKVRQEAMAVAGILDKMRQGDLSYLRTIVPPEALYRFSEDQLLELVQRESMTEEQREAWDAKQELAAIKAEREKEAKSREDSQRAELEQREGQAIEQAIFTGLKALGKDVTVSPRLIKRLSEEMLGASLASKDPNYRPDGSESAGRAWKGMADDAVEFLRLEDPKTVIAMLPKSLKDALRKEFLSFATSRDIPVAFEAQDRGKPDKRSQKPVQASTDDAFKNMENFFKKR